MPLSTLLSASVLALHLASPAVASPQFQPNAAASAPSNWWMQDIQRQGIVPFANVPTSEYKVFRNVKDFNAKGDGSTDDTAAINEAIKSGISAQQTRCGLGCNSSTTSPAIVYFPPGNYLVSGSIIQYYYTHLIGDARNPPTIKVGRDFRDANVIDANPYADGGVNWWKNQNNFFRQIRNFNIDMTNANPDKSLTGIHWQVAQATSLQNIKIDMAKPTGNAAQQGVFIENGSGGFMTDLVFNGGKFGMNVGNQQFTTRNLTFNNCQTAINMIWNWLWTFHGVTINGCDVGINMAGIDPESRAPSVGSILLLDSTISNTPVGIATVYDPNQAGTRGTLILDNVDMLINVGAAVKREDTVILAGNQKIKSWAQGRSYVGATGTAGQGQRQPVVKPTALTDGNGRFVTKSKPQYQNEPASKFVSVKARGAKGDGITDDTKAIQAIFNCIRPDEIVYFDHGAYLITNTVKVPKNVRIVGEIWPLIMAGGDAAFKDEDNPKPVFQVGQPGDVGNVEIQDLMFQTAGPQPGAILMEFNVAGQTKGSAGLFDVHFRVGGSSGTNLQLDKCRKTPDSADVNRECMGAFMLLHVTNSASAYLENVWMWVADHELDAFDPQADSDNRDQLTIYNGRGILIESTKGAWLWGTASEHNVLSNYQLNNADNVYMAFVQTETAYYQGNPDARQPFKINPKYADPDFAGCAASGTCARTWGMRVNNSKNVFVYGGGLYSFFDNYKQTCVDANNCQDNMIAIDKSSVKLFGISTKASVNMLTLDGNAAALDKDNRNSFCGTIAAFETS